MFGGGPITYTLIIWLAGAGAGAGVSQKDYGSLKSCQAALAAFKEDVNSNGLGMLVGGVCVKYYVGE